MKRFITTVFLVLGFSHAAWAGTASPITPEYFNYGIVTNAPDVDAFAFYNAGDFEIETVSSFSVTNKNNIFGNGYSYLPFLTKDTLYFTNTVSGFMSAEPGFQFDTGTSTLRHSANFVVNQGSMLGIDGEAVDYITGNGAGSEWIPVAADNQPIASQIVVVASNIINSGSMSVGNAGLLSMVGSNVNTAFGSLTAGVLGTVDPNFDYTSDITALQGEYNYNIGLPAKQYFFVPSTGVYDLFWGITNGFNENVEAISDDLPGLEYYLVTGFRGAVGVLPDIPAADAKFLTSSYLYVDATGTNWYYNIIFVNTNFANTNITATARISDAGALQYVAPPDVYDGVEDIVQIAEPVYDVITGQIVTNGIYVIDQGAYLPTMSLSVDASAPEGVTAVPSGWSRPNAIEVTTATPLEWDEGAEISATDAFPYTPEFIYFPNTFNAAMNTVPVEVSTYGAQIGRNPADIFGSFSSLAEPDSEAALNLEYDVANLLDPTNDPARIEISADNLDLSQARMRAEGMVIFDVTNLTGGGMAAVDFAQANATIGVNSGALVISNVFPTTFKRIRGNIYAISETFENTQTNAVIGPYFIPGTNLWHYHVLVVDQNLYGSFPTAERNLELTGKKSIVVQDNLNVISSALFNTTNLTFESSNYFSQYAQSFVPATTPYLQNLFLNTNAFLGTSNLLDVGFNQDKGQAAPAGRTYTVSTITNFGRMISAAPLLQAAIIEHDGGLTANAGGSILIEASNLSMGLALPNVTNSLVADGSIDLSAITMQVRNSVISNGLAEPAALTLTATAQLTDLVSGIPTTNTNSVIINYWTVTDGFSLPVKPVMGDLYGTQIHTIATNEQYVTHTWAATDWSNNIAMGFTDNEVIGRLVLDRASSNSILHFSAAGARNAMYVDYLELTNFAYTNYSTGLKIDPNFTIYFANCNFSDPQKLQDNYPNLVWVTNFVGPNSVQVVPYTNSSIVCLMNAGVANSGTIAFWDSIPNYDFLQKFGPYLLNGPFGTNFMDCPGTYTYPCNCTPGTNAYQLVYTNGSTAGGASNLVLLTVSYDGQGTVSPVLTASQLAVGNAYTLTATPAKGWDFQEWTTVMSSNIITSYSNKLTFAFVTNTVVTAYFIPIPFPSMAGAYNGLFSQTNGVAPGSSGAVSLTLTKSGSFSGKLLMGSTSYKFASVFSGAGAAQFQATSGAESLTVNLQLDITNQPSQILGEVSSASWSAVLEANLAPVWTSKNPSPLAGSYTMSLPWETGTVATPGGDSYAVGTISKLGVLTLAGALADGATLSASAPVSASGLSPFYFYDNAARDSVLGWVSVSSGGLSSTSVTWSKVAGKGPLYAAGFTNVLQMVGSTWQVPSGGSAVLSLTNPTVVLSGGDLPATPLSLPANSKSSLIFASTNVNLTIKSSSGLFSGWFDHPDTGRRVTISGVVLTDANSARGFFLGTNESGAVLLESQ
jgi:hypothetical protein